jgi:hypothetical protein
MDEGVDWSAGLRLSSCYTYGRERIIVIKYSPAGEEQWRDVVEGTSPNGLLGTIGTVMGKDSARAVAVNPTTGAVAVTGFTQNKQSLDLTVASVTADGTEAWRKVVSGVGARLDRVDAALALAADPRGRCAVMGGYTQNTAVGLLGTMQDFTLVKSCGGELRWRRVLHDTEPHLDRQHSHCCGRHYRCRYRAEYVHGCI